MQILQLLSIYYKTYDSPNQTGKWGDAGEGKDIWINCILYNKEIVQIADCAQSVEGLLI